MQVSDISGIVKLWMSANTQSTTRLFHCHFLHAGASESPLLKVYCSPHTRLAGVLQGSDKDQVND